MENHRAEAKELLMKVSGCSGTGRCGCAGSAVLPWGVGWEKSPRAGLQLQPCGRRSPRWRRWEGTAARSSVGAPVP